MASPRRAGALLIIGLTFAAAPSLASAACPKSAQCGRVSVPLSRSGAAPGTLSIAYAKLPATGARTGTLVLLSGGPGQAALPLTTRFGELIKPLRTSFDVVTVDQRGTGGSGAVDCPLGDLTDVTDCAAKLGEQRAFLNTPETAKDLEDVRAALGVDKLTLFGVSYGASVASEYVRRFPEHTAAVVLDSPTPVDGLDGVDQLRTFGAPRVLREVCFPGLCDRTVGDPTAALARAVARLQDGALRGPSVFENGRVVTGRVTEAGLYSALASSDQDPVLRAALPAAIASLAAGDAAPLLHLVQLRGGLQDDGAGVSNARFLATTCIESLLPWAPDSPVASRAGALKAFIAEHTAAFAPFSPEVVVGSSITTLCAAWPPTPRPEPVPYAGPNVPVLVLSGRQDLRTPLESARRTAAQYPNAKVLAVPAAGHSVLSTDISGCAFKGLAAFLAGQAVEVCTPSRFEVPAAPYAPATLARLRPTRLPGLRGRTYSALTVTLTGIGFDAIGLSGDRLPGLRAGWVRVRRDRLELHGVEWIQGVRISGTILGRGARGTLTISGPAAAPGTVTLSRTRISGTLGGRPFSISAR